MIEEFQKILSNWIAEATAPEGRLPDGIPPSAWIAGNAVAWWRKRIQEDVDAIETAASAIRKELEGLEGWKKKELDEVMHELIHLDDCLAELRQDLGFEARFIDKDNHQGGS